MGDFNLGKIWDTVTQSVRKAASGVEQAASDSKDSIESGLKMAQDTLKTNVAPLPPSPGALVEKVHHALQSVQRTASTVGEALSVPVLSEWHRDTYGGPPLGPFPGMAALKQKFPQAGLPDKLIGTTIDDQLMYGSPKTNPDALMSQLSAMGMNTVRLGAYWDMIQPDATGKPDFSRLDEFLSAAQKHGIRVVLSVGDKGPAWPEYHLPKKWADQAQQGKDITADPEFQKESMDFVRLVAEHEAKNPAIAMWQVENEPFDLAGPNKLALSPDLVSKEAEILRQADGHQRPLLINCWSEGDRRDELDQAFRIADTVGLDVYPKVPIPDPTGAIAWDRTVGTPSYALELAKKTGKPAMIAELQADDWGSYKANGQDVSQLTHDLNKLGYENLLFWRMDQNVRNDKAGDHSLTNAETQLAHEALPPKNP